MNKLQAAEKRYANLKFLWEEKVKEVNELKIQNDILLEALQYLDTTIMPEERKYDEWGYCKIHKDILIEFDTIIKRALEDVK